MSVGAMLQPANPIFNSEIELTWVYEDVPDEYYGGHFSVDTEPAKVFVDDGDVGREPWKPSSHHPLVVQTRLDHLVRWATFNCTTKLAKASLTNVLAQ